MSLETLIYVADVCGSISYLVGILIFALALVTFWAVAYTWLEMDDRYRVVFWAKMWPRTLAPLIVFSIIGVFVPGKSAIYLMAGASYAKDIANNPEAKRLGDKVLKALNVKLDELAK